MHAVEVVFVAKKIIENTTVRAEVIANGWFDVGPTSLAQHALHIQRNANHYLSFDILMLCAKYQKADLCGSREKCDRNIL